MAVKYFFRTKIRIPLKNDVDNNFPSQERKEGKAKMIKYGIDVLKNNPLLLQGCGRFKKIFNNHNNNNNFFFFCKLTQNCTPPPLLLPSPSLYCYIV